MSEAIATGFGIGLGLLAAWVVVLLLVGVVGLFGDWQAEIRANREARRFRAWENSPDAREYLKGRAPDEVRTHWH